MNKRFRYTILLVQFYVSLMCFPFPLSALTRGELIIVNNSSVTLNITFQKCKNRTKFEQLFVMIKYRSNCNNQ